MTPGNVAERAAAVRRQPIVRELIELALRVRVIDSALALASRLFVAVIPLALLITALAPAGQTFADRLVTGLSLEGAGRAAAEELFAAPDAVRAGLTVASLLLVVYSVASCGGVLQRMYRVAWGVESGDGFVADMRQRAIWTAGFILYVGATFAAPADSDVWLGLALQDLLRTAAAIAFFAWTPYILLGRRVAPLMVLPTALISAFAIGAVTAVAPLYVPGVASAAAESYGLVGFAFAFLSWLFAQSVLTVSAAVVGAVLGKRLGGEQERARCGT